jgi:alpha,alpha-trehalase
VHAWLYARRDPGRSWELLEEAARGDLDDIQGGTTKEGIHLGAMAGTLDIVQRAYTGLETQGDVLRLDPAVPEALVSLAFTIRYRGHLVDLEFTTSIARVRVDVDEGEAITVAIRGEHYELVPGELLEVDLTVAPV